MQALTERQAKIMEIIRQSIRERGYPPTLREIGAQMGIRSTNGVSDHLRALERKGYLRHEDMKSRALRLVEPVATSSVLDELATCGHTEEIDALRTALDEARQALRVATTCLRVARLAQAKPPRDVDAEIARAVAAERARCVRAVQQYPTISRERVLANIRAGAIEP